MNDERTTDSDAPVTSSERRDINRLERTKADDKATDIRFKELEKDIEETKGIAQKARKQAYAEHPCHQEVRVEAVEQRATGWDKWFKGIVVVVLASVVTIGGAMAALHYTKADASEVEAVKADVTEIKGNVSDIQESQERIEAALEPQVQMELEEARMELIKKALTDAVQEVRADIQEDPPARHRRRPRRAAASAGSEG